jgi:outer membrane protein assembly factor BamB
MHFTARLRPLAVPLVALLAIAAAASPLEDLRATTVSAQRRVTELQGAYERLIVRDATPDDSIVSLTLLSKDRKPLIRMDLHMRQTRCPWGVARALDQDWIHEMDVGNLTVVGSTGVRSLSGSAEVRFLTPDSVRTDGSSEPVTVQLNVRLSRNEVAGTFECGRHACMQFVGSGLVEGPVPASPPTPPPAQVMGLKLGEATSSTLHLLCEAWERHGLRIGAQIRATEHARAVGRPVQEVIGQHPVHLPTRPAIVGAAAAKAKPGTPIPANGDPDAVPSLDEVTPDETPKGGGKGRLDEVAGFAGKMREDSPETIARRLASARIIERHLTRMASAAEAQVELGNRPDGFVNGSLTTSDPGFGPWYGFEPLPERDGHVNAVAADAGGDGVPLWLNVERWRILGPFEGAAFANVHIPDVMDTEDAIYSVKACNQVIMSGQNVASEIHTPGTNTWRDKSAEPATGAIRPWQFTAPRGHESDHPGLPGGTFYFATTVWAEKDMDLWAGACVDDAGLVWVNERLACSLPGLEPSSSVESVGLFRIRLRKGINTIVARVDNVRGSTGLWLRLCVRGRPRTAEEARTQMAAAAERAAAIQTAENPVRGWRGNWSGHYPSATPPLAWDKDKGINILWRTRVGWSKAMPVVAGDRVFVTSEPIFLVCLDKMTGRVLWEREMNVLELKDPRLHEESRSMLKVWKDAEAELREMEANPAAASQADNRVETLRARIREGHAKWWDFVTTKGGIQKSTPWGNYLGHLFATPVTDGKYIWVKCAAGVTACFDREGNRRWMVQTDYPDNGMTLCSSPVLAEGRLILELPTALRGESEAAGKQEPALKMVGLDAETGRTAWEAPRVHNLQASSSPVPVRLTNGRDEMTVIVTGGGRGPLPRKGEVLDVMYRGGTVVRADDGKILIPNLGLISGWSSPVVVGDRVVHIGLGYSTCTRLVMVNRDVVGAVRVWTQDTTVHDSAVVPCGDLLVGLDGGQWPGSIRYYDAATGVEMRKQVNLNTVFGKFGRGYCPASCVSDYVFVSDDGTGFAWTPHSTKMFAVQAGRDGRLVARNKLETNMVPAPAFDGDRMYARSVHSLLCIGYTGEEGRAYEADVVARTLMEDIAAEPPTASDAREIAALADLRVPHIGGFTPLPAHVPWNFIGPCPAAQSNAVLDAVGGPKLAGYIPSRESGTNAPPDLYMDRWNDRRFSVRGNRQVLDLYAPSGRQPNAVSIFYWAFETKQARTVSVVNDREDVDLWVSGERVGDRARLRLAAGRHVVMIRVVSGNEIPENTQMDLQFQDSSDVAANVRAWQEAIRRNRTHLERVIRLCPGSETAAEAKKRLAAL